MIAPSLPRRTVSEPRHWPGADGVCSNRLDAAEAEGLPANLAEWLGENRLEHLVQQVVNAAIEPLRASGSWGPLLAMPGTEMLVKSLVLAYAKGVYASSEIELDRRMSELWAGTPVSPSATSLRRVRRELRSLVESALALVVQAAWEASATSIAPGRRPSCSPPCKLGWRSDRTVDSPDFGALSRERVGLAVQADRMEMDEAT